MAEEKMHAEGDELFTEQEIEASCPAEEMSVMGSSKPKPALPSAGPVSAGYFQTPIQALPSTSSTGVPYFNTLLRIHANIVPEVFGGDPVDLEVALTAMDGRIAYYSDGRQTVNQHDGVYPIRMRREFGNPPGGIHFQLPLTIYYVNPGIRYFVEVQKGTGHSNRRVFEHPIVWNNNRIVFDYQTRFDHA